MTETAQYDDVQYEDGSETSTSSPTGGRGSDYGTSGTSTGYGTPGRRPGSASSRSAASGSTAYRRHGIAGIAQSKLLDLAENGKLSLVDSFEGFAAMTRDMADKIEGNGNGLFGGYARQAANLVGELQDTLRDKPVDELLDEGRDLIRSQPGLAVGLAVAIGFFAARLVKSADL